jgi:hypothetical protein
MRHDALLVCWMGLNGDAYRVNAGRVNDGWWFLLTPLAHRIYTMRLVHDAPFEKTPFGTILEMPMARLSMMMARRYCFWVVCNGFRW